MPARRAAPEIVAANSRRADAAGKMSQKELEAEAFAMWSDQMDRNGAAGIRLHTGVRRAWQRIRQMVQRIGNYLRGRGYQTLEEVFGRAKAGEAAKRAPRAAAEAPSQVQVLDYSMAERRSARAAKRRPGRATRTLVERLNAILTPAVDKLKQMRPQDRRTAGDGETAGVYSPASGSTICSRSRRCRRASARRSTRPTTPISTPGWPRTLRSRRIQTLHDTYVAPMIDAMRGKASLEELHRFMYALHAEERNQRRRRAQPARQRAP